jgi:hypothetical protein
MPAVSLSPVAGVGWQFLDNNGNPLSGGKLFTYAAGTTTNQATYTSSSGNTAHTNPIILDAAGRVSSGEVWLADGQRYKFLLKTSADVQLWSADNVSGINDFSSLQPIIYNGSGNAVTVAFTLPSAPDNENTTNVYINGVYQQKNTYSVAGVTLTFSEAPPINSTIEVSYV